MTGSKGKPTRKHLLFDTHCVPRMVLALLASGTEPAFAGLCEPPLHTHHPLPFTSPERKPLPYLDIEHGNVTQDNNQTEI